MKNFITLILLFSFVSGYAQVPVYRGRIVEADEHLHPPPDTILPPAKVGELRYRSADSSLYYCISLTGKKWQSFISTKDSTYYRRPLFVRFKTATGYDTVDIKTDTSIFWASALQGVAVSTTTPINGQALLYNSTSGKWEPGAGGGGGVSRVGLIDSVTKSANGAVISGISLFNQTADVTFPGLVSTTAQTWAGIKTAPGFIANGTLRASGGTGALQLDAQDLGSFYLQQFYGTTNGWVIQTKNSVDFGSYTPMSLYLNFQRNNIFTLSSAGNFGFDVGTTSPTDAMDIKAGTASYASLRLRAGVAKTTTVGGEIYGSASGIFYAPGTTGFKGLMYTDLTNASANAINAILPTQTSNANKFLMSDGTNTSFQSPIASTTAGVVFNQTSRILGIDGSLWSFPSSGTGHTISFRAIDYGFETAGDLNYTPQGAGVIDLPTITANRTLMLAGGNHSGEILYVYVSNTSGFAWSSQVSIKKNSDGTLFTTLVNGKYYMLVGQPNGGYIAMNF